MTSMPPRGAQGHDHEASEGKEGVGEECRLHCLPIFDVPCTEGGGEENGKKIGHLGSVSTE